MTREGHDEEHAPVRRVRLFGLDFADLTNAGLIERIADAVRTKARCWIATANVQLVCLAERDPGFRATLRGADLITADGMPIVWISRLLGRPLSERVTGSDLMLPLAERAAANGWRLFLLGGAPGVPERVSEMLSRRFPGLQIVGTASPFFEDREALVDEAGNEPLLKAIHEARPDVVLVAFGAPKQERWIERHLAGGQVDVPVMVGVGGSFDFLIGRQRRAPRWLRRIGLEWAFRMATQPARLAPRYARDTLTFTRLGASELIGRES